MLPKSLADARAEIHTATTAVQSSADAFGQTMNSATAALAMVSLVSIAALVLATLALGVVLVKGHDQL